jgi:hypothetical protein
VIGTSCADIGAPANAPARSKPDIKATFIEWRFEIGEYINYLLSAIKVPKWHFCAGAELPRPGNGTPAFQT